MSISGDYAIAGASYSAYIFERGADGTWAQTAKLEAEDVAARGSFGGSVSISGAYAIVGCRYDDDKGQYSGSAYTFARGADGTWSQSDELTASDGEHNDEFGSSVSMSGGYALVGASGDDDDGGDNSGSAYVFECGADGTWAQTAKLEGEDGARNDFFGESVSISGNHAIFGATGGSASGSAYVFERGADGTWTQKSKLTASDGATEDCFAWSVSISGDYAIIGVVHDDDNGKNSGSAYIFKRNADGTWTEGPKFSPEIEWQFFGQSVSISGNCAVVGAHADNDNGHGAGAAYVFECGADGIWSQKAKLITGDGEEGDQLGYSIAISGGHAIVGAPNDDDNGSAYVYEGVPEPATLGLLALGALAVLRWRKRGEFK